MSVTARAGRAALVLALSAAAVSAAGSSRPPVQREDEVLDVVRKFFDTMRSRDVEGATETLIVDGQFMSIREGTSRPTVRATPLTSYLEGLGTGTRLQEERMWDPVVKIHGRIAMVWTPYDFHDDGELSHCGIDVFTLLRTEEGWRIANVSYTVEPEGCETLERPER